MSGKKSKFQKLKFKPNYLSSITIISLVLFLLGFLGIIIIHAQELSEYFKENIEVSLIFQDNARETEILQFEKQLEAEDYIKQVKYVSKEDAAEILKKEYGEDFISLLGYNPLYGSLNIHLKADYANSDSLKWIEKSILANKTVKEVYYQKTLVDLINKNVKNVGIIIIMISFLLFIIAVSLIDNAIRLTMYSNRFLIKSMQLVGATRAFIIGPFTKRGISNGLISGLLAVIVLFLTIRYAQNQLPDLILIQDWTRFTLLFLVIILIGVLISWLSIHRSVSKYLKTKIDELY